MEEGACGVNKRMLRDFHIFAFDLERRFRLKGVGGEPDQEFSSLFEAARHARAIAGAVNGFVVINNEFGKATNRIPFHITCDN
jgi:hypothetical protein